MRAGVVGLVVAGIVLAGCGSSEPPERERREAVQVKPSPSKVTGEPMSPEDLEPESPAPVRFGQAVRYKDGLMVEVPAITPANVDEFAVGDGDAKAGDALTVFTVRVTNKAGGSFDASLVGVSVTYGKAGEQAEQIFQGRLGDGFAGVVPAGQAQTARWGYVVPAGADVTLQVDPADGVHGPAVFTGPAEVTR